MTEEKFLLMKKIPFTYILKCITWYIMLKHLSQQFRALSGLPGDALQLFDVFHHFTLWILSGPFRLDGQPFLDQSRSMDWSICFGYSSPSFLDIHRLLTLSCWKTHLNSSPQKRASLTKHSLL